MQDRLFSLGPAQQTYIVSGGGTNPSSIDMRIQGIGPSGEILPTDELRGPIRYNVTGTLMLPFPLIINQLKDESLQRPERYNVLEYFARVPSNLNPAIEALTERLLEEDDKPWDIANKLREHLYKNYAYSLDPTQTFQKDQIYNFLFSSRSGHCEYFAATFALMLRLSGVPARVVGGYQGGYWDDSDEVIIFTGKNAHVWVEWYHPRLGWVIDDATPVVYSSAARLEGMMAFWERLRRYWDDYVVEYNLDTQAAFIGKLVKGNDVDERRFVKDTKDSAVPWGWGVTVAVLFGFGLLGSIRRRRQRYRSVAYRLEQIFRHLSSRKIKAPQTLFEAFNEINIEQSTLLAPSLFHELKSILVLYHQYRFSAQQTDTASWNKLDKRTKELLRSIKGKHA